MAKTEGEIQQLDRTTIDFTVTMASVMPGRIYDDLKQEVRASRSR